MSMGYSKGRLRPALPATQTQHSMLVYLQGWHATSAIAQAAGAEQALTYLIPAFAVKMPVLITKGQPAGIATRPTFPRLHASHATTAIIQPMVMVAVVMIK